MSKHLLENNLRLAAGWLSDIAQVKNVPEGIVTRHLQKSWKGAIRGEYSVADKKWSFFCPVWHTGQAVKALVGAYEVLGERKFLDSALLGADFILNNSESEGSGQSMILAFEDYDDKINTSAILECLDGLHVLNEHASDRYRDLFMGAAKWIVEKAWIKGQGLYRDLYYPAEGCFLKKAYGGDGRPLLDDGILLKAYYLTKDKSFREAFFETADRLLKDEYPAGNWLHYAPCKKDTGSIHPRQAYWWGYPMFMAYRESGERKYLECALRSCRWYVNAQRKDGGLIRGTYLDFNTDSFGHATSGICCAIIMWCEAVETTGSDEFLEPLKKALDYCVRMQFSLPEDGNLKGSVLEKVQYPDGTDRHPYHIRDLGTIFFAQAVKRILESNASGEIFPV